MTDPVIIERGGIRTERRRDTDACHDLVKSINMATGAAVTCDIPQAHELLDQLALQLGRPDIVVAHRHLPQRRTQPGEPPRNPRGTP